MAEKKGRLLFLEHYLLEHSDKDNPVTTEELLQAYEEHGLTAHRNTVRDDLATLQEEGIEIDSVRVGKGKGHYIANRSFEFMSGDFPVLKPGLNAVSWSGNVSNIIVRPNWRYL